MKVLMTIVLVAGCGGGSGADWVKAKRTKVTAAASDIAFSIEVPDSFKKKDDPKYPEWSNGDAKVEIQVSNDKDPGSIGGAVRAVGAANGQSIDKQVAVPGGYEVQRATPEKGVLFVDVFRNGALGTLLCHAGVTAKGGAIADYDAVKPAIEQIGLSMEPGVKRY